MDRLRASIKASSFELKSLNLKTCPKCGSKLVKNGKRKLKYRGKIQRYYCKRCKHSSTDNEFPNFTFPKEVVFTSVDLYVDGLSLQKVRFRVSKKILS